MSTPPYFTMISEVLPIQRRDFYAADTTLLNPNGSNPLLDGEWLELDSTYKAARGATGSGAHEAVVPSWVLFAERGRYDTQSIGKVPLLFNGGFEAETKIADLTGLSVGDALVVQDVTISSLTRRGLKKLSATSGEHLVFGYATKVLADRVRFWTMGPHWKHVT